MITVAPHPALPAACIGIRRCTCSLLSYILYPPPGLRSSCKALQIPRADSAPGAASSVRFLSGLSLAPEAERRRPTWCISLNSSFLILK